MTQHAAIRPPTQWRVRIGSPAALLAVVPGLLTFHPVRSMVVIGTEPPRARVRVALRYDLPDPPGGRQAASLARHALDVLAAQGISAAAAVGYGPDELVAPVAAALRARAAQAGVTITELLRVENQRYWSYLCADQDCCPPEGTVFDVTDHPAARAIVPPGATLVASRAELAATVAPARGKVAAAMRQATKAAERTLTVSAARLAEPGLPVSAGRLAAAIGVAVARDAILRYRAGARIGPQHAALLSVALRELRVRDDAWSRMLPAHLVAHQRLWTDLTRLARPGYVSPPAALLAFVAWQSGNGALANVALDRALDDDPDYSMAILLRQALDSGAPPSLARLPMTPQEVAASYDALEAGKEGDYLGSDT